MRGKLTVTQNLVMFIVLMEVSNNQIKQASKLIPNPLVIVDENKNTVFELAISPATYLNATRVSLPLEANNEKVLVSFPIDTQTAKNLEDTKYLIARAQTQLKIVEKQILTALAAMDKEIKTVEVLDFRGEK
jgi:hypothetical protein